MKLNRYGALASLLLAACGGSASTTNNGGATAASSAGGEAPAAARRFGVAEGAVQPDPSESRPAIGLSLAADGAVSAPLRSGGRETWGRFDGDRYVSATGAEVLRIAADGTIAMPWRGPTQTLSLRYVGEALEVNTGEGAPNLLTMDAEGYYVHGGRRTGDRFTPYAPALRETALMLRVLPMVVLMYGFAQQPAPAATPAPAAAP